MIGDVPAWYVVSASCLENVPEDALPPVARGRPWERSQEELSFLTVAGPVCLSEVGKGALWQRGGRGEYFEGNGDWDVV